MNKHLIAACAFLPPLLSAQTDMGHVIPPGRSVHVLAIGDWGSGSTHQMAVATAIATRHHDLPFDLGVTMGDNFYRCGVRSTKDEMWKRRFEDLYVPLGIKFYAALGNHDYGHPAAICPGHLGSADAEVSYTGNSASWRMPARYYTFAAGPVRFFALDTEGWSDRQLDWLRQALADSQNEEGVKWRVVYGHHPLHSSGAHMAEPRIAMLRELLTPVFEKNHVDLYLAGHDHDMEHLRKDGIEFVVCGASGAELRKVGRTQPESIFHATTYGFADLVAGEERLTVNFYDTELHALEDPELLIRK